MPEVRITVLNPAGDMTYSAAVQHVNRGARIDWTSDGPIAVSFRDSPLDQGRQVRSDAPAGPVYTASATVGAAAKPGTYYYAVAAVKDGRVYLDAGCPQIIVV